MNKWPRNGSLSLSLSLFISLFSLRLRVACRKKNNSLISNICLQSNGQAIGSTLSGHSHSHCQRCSCKGRFNCRCRHFAFCPSFVFFFFAPCFLYCLMSNRKCLILYNNGLNFFFLPSLYKSIILFNFHFLNAATYVSYV